MPPHKKNKNEGGRVTKKQLCTIKYTVYIASVQKRNNIIETKKKEKQWCQDVEKNKNLKPKNGIGKLKMNFATHSVQLQGQARFARRSDPCNCPPLCGPFISVINKSIQRCGSAE